MAFAGVYHGVARQAQGCHPNFERFNRRARQRDVVTHLVDITTCATEVSLHVNDDERRVVGTQVTIKRPGVGIGDNKARHSGAPVMAGAATVPGTSGCASGPW